MSKLNSALYNAPTDQFGNKIEFDVREDDERPKKLQEIVDLLVAAGYFRARIKGLSEFDKIVGGLTWCITTCNYDVDVDLLFQENLTIGLKIGLTERIVAVLPRMKCPHMIEPHQIQGLDFIHIYPVIQWLVKRAIETRAEMGDANRAFALSQFSKENPDKKDEKVELKTVNYLKENNLPQRKYCRRDAHKIGDKNVRIQSTLLEYGKTTYLSRPSAEIINQNASAKSVPASLKQAQEQQQQQLNEAMLAEDENLKKLINTMSATDQKNRVTANAVGQILGLQSNEIQEMAALYANKENELQQELDQLDKLSEMGGGMHKQRLINILNKQIEQKESEINEKNGQISKLEEKLNESRTKFDGLKEIENGHKQEIQKLDDINNNADPKVTKKLEELVAIYDEQKGKESEFKKKCKDELAKLQNEIDKKNNSDKTADNGETTNDENEKYDAINEQYDNLKQKLHSIRLKIAKKNREMSLLQRKLDEIPSRVELSQYQKRFVELYNQISTVHTQTKQFYILYNALEDKKVYMSKEISLLNSVHEQFSKAMLSQNTKEQFLKQLELISDGINQNLIKIDSKKQEQKSKKDGLNDKYIDLIEKKRIYYKTLKDFQEECKKNETLVAKLQSNN